MLTSGLAPLNLRTIELQAIIQDSEDELKQTVHEMYALNEPYNLKTYVKETKLWHLKAPTKSVRFKIFIENQMLEQVSHCNSLGCNLILKITR